ncbi:hypothetical protein O0L34_g1383 [Tuta absoluta]|nr:hypothetical protein O0L34_g1383 [Tuta absoluta]
MKEVGLDPLTESLKAIEEVTEKVNNYAKGLLVIFHGSPGEDPYRFSEYLDDYEIVAKKLEWFSNKTIGTPHSKTSKKKEKEQLATASSQNVAGTGVATFQMEIIEELLGDFFGQEKFQCGFIIDSLTSSVVKSPSVVLTTVLKCKKTIWSINLVLFHSDFNHWAQEYEEATREAELAEEHLNAVKEYSREEIEQIVTNFEGMDAEEYENADPELKAIYIKNGLELRRRKYLEKRPVDIVVVKASPEFLLYQSKYSEYQKNVYETLVVISNNWIIEDGELGLPLHAVNGALLGFTQKKKKPNKSEINLDVSLPMVEEEKPKGFPLTIVICPCENYKEGLVGMFKCPFIESKLEPPTNLDLLVMPVKREEYTVLMPKTMPQLQFESSLNWRFLAENPIKKCECNQITDLHILDDTTQENVLNILAKWHCECGKMVQSNQTSTSASPDGNIPRTTSIMEYEDPFFYPLPLHAVPSVNAPEERLILAPGDLVRCKYAFNPKNEGHFSIKRYVEVYGWPESKVVINITGICDLPRLDNRPKKMFANFVRRTLEDEVYKLSYLDDLKKFEFGPIFVGLERVYEEEYTIDLRNASLLTADVDIEFIDPTDIFAIDKRFISLEPGCRDHLKVTAAPPSPGDHTTNLLFCIKDNPEIINITISCSGVLPIYEILPLTKKIDFGMHLLYRREDDRFIVKNDSILPIMWKIRNPEDFEEDFIISRTSGIVPRNENHVVAVTYIACNVGIITELPMTIDIFDEKERGYPMVVDSLWLSAECYDVMVECAFEDPNQNFLDFGNVKVNSTEYRSILKKVKNFPEPALLKSFECIPSSGIIAPSLRLVAVEFQCTPTTHVNLNNVPAYTCSLLDGSKEQVVVAKFPVGVTIASFYNTFTLFPLGELNFHIIAVGSGVMREVTLNNTSKCPFNYTIEVPEQYRELAPVEPLPKVPHSKLKTPPIKCGNFLIVNDDNLLAPGDSKSIMIQFLATEARTFEETINFIVSDTCPAEAGGVPLKLIGTGAMPVLDFWNLENTFREHLIVKNMNEYKVPEASPHCVFTEDSVSLHFFCVNVHSKHTGSIDLYNHGVVPCILNMKLIYQTNTTEDIFYLHRNDMQIEPLMHKRLGITFAPKELREYRAILEISLKLLHNQEQTFTLCLIGEGVIPRIRLIKPPIRQHRLALITFPVTCLGATTYKHLRFKNISTVNSIVKFQIFQPPADREVFWMNPTEKSKVLSPDDNEEGDQHQSLEITLLPNQIAALKVFFSPLIKGRTNCDIKITIIDNPYEFYTVMCEAEAFAEDVILIGLEMLPMDFDIEAMQRDMGITVLERKKSKSAPTDKRKALKGKTPSTGEIVLPTELKYLLDFGGCELSTAHKRTVIMLNNSEKVYKFQWPQLENILIKPAVGYISPGEEKDIEIIFFSALPVNIKKDLLVCRLVAINDDVFQGGSKGATWDNRQIQTVFGYNPETGQNERAENAITEPIPKAGRVLGVITIIILYSVTTEYIKYVSDLDEEIQLSDTYIYQKQRFSFKVENVGVVPIKISWNFFTEDEYPGRIDKRKISGHQLTNADAPTQHGSLDDSNNTNNINRVDDSTREPTGSKETLFSGSVDRMSVDTWFEMDMPFSIEPARACLNPQDIQMFTVTFSPIDAFDFTVRLRSTIDNLDPYDQNLSSKIKARSLVPYVHLDTEESDYLTSGRRKDVTGMKVPKHTEVLEFNVVGSGCYSKTFQVLNPTSEAYEFVITPYQPDQSKSAPTKPGPTSKDFIPVHCNKLKGFLEGGTSTSVMFTFAPTAPGVVESKWSFKIPQHDITIPLMVVGIVREPEVIIVPTIMIIKSSLVGFTTTHNVILKNNENEPLPFEFKGDSIVEKRGKTIVTVRPNSGVLKPNSETKITIYYTPVQDGPLSFKIFCRVAKITKDLTLCVKALSMLIKPTVLYYIIGNEHVLDYDVVTNIHLEQTASTYERRIPFKIKNDGSTSFSFEWNYAVASVKKYLTVSVEPRTGYIAPASEVECILHFTLKTVPVEAYPVTLTISDGPLYQIYLYAQIEKPLYHFSLKEYDFGKCVINAPQVTYKKNLAFTNDDKVPITIDIATDSVAELYLDYRIDPYVTPGQRAKIPIYFRPKAVKHYEFKIKFWVNSLCEEIIYIRGEGVPLLVDLYEGCQKSFDLGPVKIGEKIVREIEVMNHTKVPIECNFVFKELYSAAYEENEETNCEDASAGTSICIDPKTPGLNQALKHPGQSRLNNVKLYRDENKQKQIKQDIAHALASVKVIPNKATIKPHRRIPLKILFKPVGLISQLNVQLNAVVLEMIRPLVLLNGSATGMSLCLSQNSLQFGRVRKRGCKKLKVMLYNKGDFDAQFCWQPLKSDEFTIEPMQGTVAARQNITFTISFRPQNYNPFVKVWAICNIENYKSLDLAIFAACVDMGIPQIQSLYMECPVRERKTDYIAVTNPTDETWFILSEFSEETSSFETLREFYIEANSVFQIPIHFKPKTFGQHEAQVLYSPIGESALFVTLIGAALHPNPTNVLDISVEAKKSHTETLIVNNITEEPELYIVATEMIKVVPDKFDGYYEIKYPDLVRVWGEAQGTCLWTFICYEECQMNLRVMFVNEVTREYQFYEINVNVTPSTIVDTIKFTCRARESMEKELEIVNPLNKDSIFNVASSKLSCDESITVARQSTAKLLMTYSPLVVGEFEDTLTVENYLVGTYTYRILAICLPAKEKTLDYSTPLGTSIPIRLRVCNKSDTDASFVAHTNHPSIHLDKNYDLQSYDKGKFQVRFEPTELGLHNARVVFSSDVAGQFVFSLNLTGTDPKPKGPYNVKAGSYTFLKFKNVFDETHTFRIFVDCEEFSVKTQVEQIKPKREIKIQVFLSGSHAWKEPPTGCLNIENFEPADPKVHWTYFLQGVL